MLTTVELRAKNAATQWRAIAKKRIAWLLTPGIPAGALVAASFLKVHQLTLDPIYHLQPFSSRWLTLGIAELELILGFWLISGIAARWARWSALVGFTSFTIVNATKVLHGADTCGCFGPVEIRPTYMLAFDLLVMAQLLFWRSPRPADDIGQARASHQAYFVTVLGLLIGALQVAAALTADYSPFLVSFDRGNAGQEVTFVLEPNKWVGKPLPILSRIRSSGPFDLATGKWIILLYDPTCNECQKFLERLAETPVDRPPNQFGIECVALIEVPRKRFPAIDRKPPLQNGEFVQGSLTQDVIWYVQTPVAIKTNNGEVIKTTNDSEELSHWLRQF